ncbi:MAG: PHP domain-containing protein [Rhodospirillales bacterium]|nr:PHP domain-containing protein [Rhodospirillales bacterium]
MSVNPFARAGRFFRGNLHTHSTASDGVLAPAAVAARYRDAGYDFLAVTDHFLESYGWPITDTRPSRSKDFTTIIGAELHTPKTLLNGNWHILAVGLPFDFAPARPGETGPELAARARAAGAFVAIAHPEWYGLTLDEGRALEAAHAVEVYNHTCWAGNNRAEGWFLCDGLLAEGRRINAIAVDDAHFKFDDFAGGWVQVRADALDPNALKTALLEGAFYASQGPEIMDVAITGGEIHIRCSPAAFIVASGRGSATERADGPGRMTAVFPLAGFCSGGYVRVTVVDAARRRAWTNPIWLA